MTAKEKNHLALLAKIKKERKTKGFTQTFVADKLGLSQVHYSLMESGKNRMPLETFVLISEILELNFDLTPNEQEQEKRYFEKFISMFQNAFLDKNISLENGAI